MNKLFQHITHCYDELMDKSKRESVIKFQHSILERFNGNPEIKLAHQLVSLLIFTGFSNRGGKQETVMELEFKLLVHALYELGALEIEDFVQKKMDNIDEEDY